VSYDCMTPEEYALWAEQVARARANEPCHDCPLWFELAARENGQCRRRADPERRAAMRQYHAARKA